MVFFFNMSFFFNKSIVVFSMFEYRYKCQRCYFHMATYIQCCTIQLPLNDTNQQLQVLLPCFYVTRQQHVNTLRPRQNGRHFSDDIFKWIFLNENVWISLTISLKCVWKVWINNIPSLVQIMAWRRPGDKPLSEPMMVSLLTHIWVTRPQWVN